MFRVVFSHKMVVQSLVQKSGFHCALSQPSPSPAPVQPREILELVDFRLQAMKLFIVALIHSLRILLKINETLYSCFHTLNIMLLINVNKICGISEQCWNLMLDTQIT